MHCWNHRDVPANGICCACGRALCAECASDIHGAVACARRCEDRVHKLLSTRAWFMATRSNERLAVAWLRGRNVAWGVIVVGFGAIYGQLGYGAEQYMDAVLGAFAVFAGILLLYQASRRRRTPSTMPLCIACGYNLTGNTSGRCPECGYEVRSAGAK